MASKNATRRTAKITRALLLLVSLCSCSFCVAANEIIASKPEKSAGVSSSDNVPLRIDLELNPTRTAGKLKPAHYAEPEWAATKALPDQVVVQTSNETAEETEITVPPAPAGLNAPEISKQDAANGSSQAVDVTQEIQTAEEFASEPTGQETVIESNVDMRPPSVPSITEDDEDRLEPCWTNPFVDDHLYLWSETREELELLFNNGNGFGMTSLGFDSKITGGDGPIWANFKFGWHFLDGPSQPDIRSQTYDVSLEWNYAGNLNDDWTLHLQLAPTWSTDWDNKTDDAFRLIGGGLLAYNCHDGCKILIGGMFLDRPDLPFVPTAGVRFMEDDFELDLVIPRPRVAWKLNEEVDEESWFYIAGELGGGSWAVERELSRKEIMSYRDYRLLIGWESKKVDGSRDVFELGWVFDRQLDFDRYSGTRDLDDTFLMRWGHVY